ncbi:MAG: S41 family peptidase [Brevinematia bacterium]
MKIGFRLVIIMVLAGLITTFIVSWGIELYKYKNRLIPIDEVIRISAYLERLVSEIYPDKVDSQAFMKFKEELDKISKAKIKKMLPIEAFKLLQPALSHLNDQNLRIYVPNEPTYSVLPFTVKLIDKKAIVTSTASEKIPLGCEIIEINGLKINDLIDSLLKYTCGKSYEIREQQLSYIIQLSPELLWKKHRFVWIFYNQQEYDIKYVKDNKIYNEKVKTMTLLNYPKMSTKFKSLQEDPPYSFERKGKIGILKIRNFSLTGITYNRFREFLNDLFVYNRDLEKIILDIRGSSVRDFTIFKEIYEHFLEKPIEIKRSISFINTAYNLKLFEKYGVEYKTTTNEQLNIEYPIKFNPREPYSTAELWVLFDKYTTNAALDFAYIFKKIYTGRTIGERTLTKVNQTTDVVFQYFDTLKTVITYPSAKWNEISAEDNFTPDKNITITLDDRLKYLFGEDPVLENVIQMLNNF